MEGELWIFSVISEKSQLSLSCEILIIMVYVSDTFFYYVHFAGAPTRVA